jgi:hypothetical protein
LTKAPVSLVGVMPQAAMHARPRLLDTLEAAMPVRFEPRDLGAFAGLDAALVLGDDLALADRGTPVPCLVASDRPDPGERTRRRVAFRPAAALDERLHGRLLDDERAETRPVAVRDGDEVLALCDGAPVWVRRQAAGAPVDLVAAPPEELAPGQCLRDRFRAGRFLDLLPLVQFLREVSAAHAWAPPPARACLVIDDPNLHWRSYGFVDFPELAAHARRDGYHASIATVPLDGWWVHPGTARLFRSGSPLSLSVHGNNHGRRELGAPSERDALPTVAEALRRIQALERRCHVPIARMMVAPHGVCSEASMRALLRLGFEGICIDRPYPWLSRPPADRPLAGWEPSELVAGGFPVVPRQHFHGPRDDLLFRALLGQPLVLYGHHGDLADGPDLLRELATEVARLGSVHWCSMQAISRSNFSARREGDTLRIRLHARRVEVTPPADVERVVVEAPAALGHAGKALATADGDTAGTALVDLSEPGTASAVDLASTVRGVLEISLPEPDRVDPAGVPPPPWRPWPVVRRILTEGRDRAMPVYRAAERLRAPQPPARYPGDA